MLWHSPGTPRPFLCLSPKSFPFLSFLFLLSLFFSIYTLASYLLPRISDLFTNDRWMSFIYIGHERVPSEDGHAFKALESLPHKDKKRRPLFKIQQGRRRRRRNRIGGRGKDETSKHASSKRTTIFWKRCQALAYVHRYLVETTHCKMQNMLKQPLLFLFPDTPKKTAHHVSMPAGPVASALSPPPRRIMTKHTSSILERSVAIEQPKAERPPQMRLRLSLDVEQNRQSSILCTSPSSDSSSSFKRYDDDHSNTVDGRRPSLPFRSGTLGTVKSDRLYGDTPPLPLPNPALLTSNASLSSNETLRERRRRRSPLSLPGEEQLTISLRSSLSVDDDTSLDISRQRAMHALEGKVLKAESAAAPQSNLPGDALARDKAEYEAVVARSILRRTPHELTPPPSSSSSVLHHPHNQPGLKAPELPSSPSSVFTASC